MLKKWWMEQKFPYICVGIREVISPYKLWVLKTLIIGSVLLSISFFYLYFAISSQFLSTVKFINFIIFLLCSMSCTLYIISTVIMIYYILYLPIKFKWILKLENKYPIPFKILNIFSELYG